MRAIGIFIICLSSCVAYGQTNLIDSLQNILSSQPDDTTKASVLGDLCWHLKYSDPDKALEYGWESSRIAERNDYQGLNAYALNNIGIVYWAKSEYDSAAYYIKRTRQIYEVLNNDRGRIVSSTNLGLIYQNMGDYDESLKNAMQALKLVDDIDGDKSLKASVLLNIGNVHFLSEDYAKAKEYYHKSLRLKKAISQNGFNQNIQKSYLNLGNVFEKTEEMDSAIYYFRTTIPLARAASDNKSLALAYTDLGYVFSKKEGYDSALVNFNKALAVYEDSKYDNPYDESILLWSMAENYFKQKKIKTSITYAERSLEIAQKLNNNNRLKDSYELLSRLYEADGNMTLAYQASKNLRVYEDSLMNLASKSQIAELEKKYETEKKDQQILFLDQENNLQKATNQRNNIIISSLIIGVLLLLFVFYLWRQRAMIRQQEVLNEQKIRLREAQIQAVINSEEKERKRFASDLHDSMGQLVSALTMNIQGLKNASNDVVVRNEIVDNSTTLLNDIQREIRNVAFNLMPHVLTHDGLIPALQELTARINKSRQIKADVQTFGLNKRFNEVFEISLYRILQEWISNVLKYAKATEVLIQFTAHDDEVVITVEDNGQGFDLKLFGLSKGNGWRNINTRLNLINGTLDIDTQQDRKNTTLTITIDKTLAIQSSMATINT